MLVYFAIAFAWTFDRWKNFMLSQSSPILYTTRNILRSFVNTCTKLSVVGMAMVLVFTFHFSYFFCPIKFFLFEFSGGWEMRFMSVTEILLKRKMFKLFAKLIMRGRREGLVLSEHSSDTRNSKIQQSFVCDESYFTFATVFRSLSFFNGNALGSGEQSENPMFLDFAKQALC